MIYFNDDQESWPNVLNVEVDYGGLWSHWTVYEAVGWVNHKVSCGQMQVLSTIVYLPTFGDVCFLHKFLEVRNTSDFFFRCVVPAKFISNKF